MLADLLFTMLGFAHDPTNLIANVVYGALHFLPIFIVTFAVGGTIEMIF